MNARRGEVWLVSLDPVEGHEQAGRRPALILSVDVFNASPAELVTVLPITSKKRQLRTRVALAPGEAGLRVASFIIGEQARTISSRRLKRRLGAVRPETLEAIEDIVRMLLGL
jgi:mRNA interferase MazF